MESKSKMTEVLSQVAALGSKIENQASAQAAALEKLREEKADLLNQQREALVDGDSEAYVSATKKLEGKQMLIEYSEKRLRQLKAHSADIDQEATQLYSSLRGAALADIIEIDKRAITAVDALLEISDQAGAVFKAFLAASAVLTQYVSDSVGTSFNGASFALEHNSLTLLHQRLKNARQALEAEIQRGR